MRALTTRQCLAAEPVCPEDPTSPWLIASAAVPQALCAARGRATYVAHPGLLTGVRGIQQVRVCGRLPDGTVVVERRGARRRGRIRRDRALVAPDRVYPLIRGRDVPRRRCAPSAHLLVPGRWAPRHRPRPYAERQPALGVSRGNARSRALRRQPSQHGRVAHSLSAVGQALGHLYGAHRVVWRRTGTALAAAVLALARRYAVPNRDVAVVPCYSAAEAYYLAGALNSAVARVIVAATLVESSVPVPVLRWVRVPRFVAGKAHHQALAA